MPKVREEGYTVVPLTIRVVGLPPGSFEAYRQIKLGIQKGNVDVLKPTTRRRAEAIFSFDVRVEPASRRRALTFLGPHTQGPRSNRFIYLVWTGIAAGKRRMFRRIKIPLTSITRRHIQQAKESGGGLEGRIGGLDRNGGPACATVPLLGKGWIVVPPGR